MRVLTVKPLVVLFPSSFIRTKTTNPLSQRISLSFPSKTQTLDFLSPSRAMATTASSPPTVHVRDTVALTEVEERIFDCLVGTVEKSKLQTQLRVAGGWVRDKLLGKDCYDIDIALDNMLGREFVEKVAEYLTSIGEEARGSGVIQSNPDQSKHLETATMRIYNMSIDFVNLRCEEYTEDSRIPSVQRFGTPKDDALRRDLTINSLFYNIGTKSVEDYTNRGIEDLKYGRIVTPLSPKTTFLDDPLRALRAIRFGARFEFVLDEKLKEAASCEDVKAALAAKISRERIGIEIDLMIAGNQPVKAMSYLHDLTLFEVVFSLPSTLESALPEGCHRHCIAYLDAIWNLTQIVGSSSFSDEQRRLCLYAAMFLPFRQMTYTVSKPTKVSVIPLVNYFFRESLKRKASDADMVVKIHSALEKFVSLLPFLAANEDMDIGQTEFDWAKELVDIPVSSKLRVLTGILLREIKDYWRVALLISTFLHKVESVEDVTNKNFQLDELGELFKAAEKNIIESGLEKVWDVKPLINGKQIMDFLHVEAGPLVREWQQKLLVWQLSHPTGTSEECKEWMSEANSKRARTEIQHQNI